MRVRMTQDHVERRADGGADHYRGGSNFVIGEELGARLVAAGKAVAVEAKTIVPRPKTKKEIEKPIKRRVRAEQENDNGI